MDIYRKRWLIPITIGCLVVLMWVWQAKGFGQVGNALSFVGSLVALLPSAARLVLGRRYKRALRTAAGAAFSAADQAAQKAQVRRFLAFDVRDAWATAIGVALVAAGFLATILAAPNPAPGPAKTSQTVVAGVAAA